MAILMILMTMNGYLDYNPEVEDEDSKELRDVVDESFAPSPGHVVLAEYIGGQNCPPCYGYSSPDLKSLRNSNPDEFVYISYIAADYGNIRSAQAGDVAPINRISHLATDTGSNSAPRAYFGDCAHGSTSCYMGGALTNGKTYDDFFSGVNGKSNNMAASVNDYQLFISQSQNGPDADITVEATYTGGGTVDVRVLAAVTEDSCNSHPYNDGSKAGHCWKKWLVDSTNSGPISMTLSSTPSTYTWTVPVTTVNGGMSNMLSIAWLQDDWTSGGTRHSVLSASDSSMVPLIDVGVSDFDVTNQDGKPGFKTGDTLDLDLTITNNGVDPYTDGGTISVYHVDGTNVQLIDSTSINSLSNTGTAKSQSFSTTFDTSSVATTAHGLENFKVELTGLVADGRGPNNAATEYVPHDFTPSTDLPQADGSTAIPRGGTLDFDITGHPRDSIDTLVTMTPEFEVSPTGQNSWSTEWVTAPNSITAEGTIYERYVFIVEPVATAASGDYDVRARFTDDRGQEGEWKISSEAFELLNGIPLVIDPTQPGNTPASCPAFPGPPTVKVDTNEWVSLSGRVCDAETPLSSLGITSSSPAFVDWHPSNSTIQVLFTSMQYDSMGNPLPQGISLSLDDGEDTNTGTLLFDVIENGQPRWSSVPAQSFVEGGGVNLALAQYLSDTTADGMHDSSVMDLSLSVVSTTPSGILSAEIWGNNLALNAIDDDVFGNVIVRVKATDLDGQSGETDILVEVSNINDAPRFDNTGLDNLMVQKNEYLELDLASRVTDIDGDDTQVWIETTYVTPPYNPLSGILNMSWNLVDNYTVTITATDSDGAVGTGPEWTFVVKVVEHLPLTWSTDGVTGDFDRDVTNVEVGENASVYITQLSATELSNIEIRWQACNLDSLICHTSGDESVAQNDLLQGYSFTTDIAHDDGFTYGLLDNDELKIYVQGVGTNGFDYKSTAISYIVESASQVNNETGDGDGDNNGTGNDDDSEKKSEGMDSVVLGGIIGLVILLIVAGVLVAMFLRGGRSEEAPVNWGAAHSLEASTAAPISAAPAAPAAVATSEMVSDYTHLLPGGQYITGQAGETVYLAPNGTAWTMQADNSFIRTS